MGLKSHTDNVWMTCRWCADDVWMTREWDFGRDFTGGWHMSSAHRLHVIRTMYGRRVDDKRQQLWIKPTGFLVWHKLYEHDPIGWSYIRKLVCTALLRMTSASLKAPTYRLLGLIPTSVRDWKHGSMISLERSNFHNTLVFFMRLIAVLNSTMYTSNMEQHFWERSQRTPSAIED